MKKNIPQPVLKTIEKLEAHSFEVFVVGGCVRDLLLSRVPCDWDVTTNARPEEVLEVFPDGKYENRFGTVLVPEKYLGADEDSKGIVEITTYRIESKYSDKRHPDNVRFAKTLQEDLSRRDFTVNAMALKVVGGKHEIVDWFEGQKDLADRKIRAVGNANERFDEDALRMMRAIRFACQLRFSIEKETFKAIKVNKENLSHVSNERIRDELEKIILSGKSAKGIELLVETGLMDFVMPELRQTIGVKQNRHHYHGPFNTVFAHMVASLDKCPSKKLEVRLAAFLHDIGKPKTKEGEGEMATFHSHEYAGAHMVRKMLERLKFPRKVIDKTVLLVKNHMFYYNVDEVGESGVRRVVRKVGLENIDDLIDVRIADRLGSGVPKAVPYKLRHFKYMVEKVSKDPISVGQLKLKGDELMSGLNMKPGPKVGAILEVLLAKVIEQPKLNNKKDLLNIAEELKKQDLKNLRTMAKERIEKERKKEDRKTRKKYWVN
ncbi:MAG: HD domain-containing protein [Patescibacteria group bacterium]|nr:HD domain-containing protein [Patescibacteria group bacterium]